jgi:hypothetical protein
MSKFLKLTGMLLNTHYINTIMIQPNKYVIHTTNTKLFGHIGLCYGSGYGFVSADKEIIEVCETKHPTDYKIVSEWIQKTG